VTDHAAVPYRFDPGATTAEVVAAHGDLEPGVETGIEVTVAGRLMLRRGQGKLVCGQLADATGRIQLFAPADVTPEFEAFGKLSLGARFPTVARAVGPRHPVLSALRRPLGDRGVPPTFQLRSRLVSLLRRWPEDRGDALTIIQIRAGRCAAVAGRTRRYERDRPRRRGPRRAEPLGVPVAAGLTATRRSHRVPGPLRSRR
jgi:hypothetical protein